MTLPRPWAILAASLVADTVLFGATADYPPPLHDGLVALLSLASAASGAWALSRSLANVGDAQRLRAVAATLLVAPFALFSLLLGIGPPHVQPARDNDLRFLVLAIAAMLVGGGLMLLKEALSAADERVHARVGLAAIVLASPLYVAFGLIQRIDYVAVELGYSWAGSVDGTKRELTPLDALSIALLYFACALTYIATAASRRPWPARAGWGAARRPPCRRSARWASPSSSRAASTTRACTPPSRTGTRCPASSRPGPGARGCAPPPLGAAAGCPCGHPAARPVPARAAQAPRRAGR